MPLPPDTIEFSMPWTQRLARMLAVPFWPLILPGLLTPLIFTLLVDDYDYRIRWPTLAALVALIVLLGVQQVRSKTVATAAGITCHETGRPWRVPRRTFVPWHDIAAIDARKGTAGVQPVLFLNDGGMIWARLPAGRRGRGISTETAELQRRHLAATGLDPARVAVPRKTPVPPVRRRVLVAGLCTVVLVADVVTVGVLVSGMFTGPPDVVSCSLVPAKLVQRIVPGAAPETGSSGTPKPGKQCQWNRPDDRKKPGGATLSLLAYASSGDYARTSYEEDRRTDRAEHVIHPIAKVDGYSWAAVDSGAVEATARTSVDGYSVKVELGSDGYGLTPAKAERQVSEVTRAAVAELDRSRS